MGLDELGRLLNGVFPTAYWSFPEKPGQSMPCITYFESASDNFGADNRVYYGKKRVSVELYTRMKDPAAEKKLEDALNAAEIYWTKTCVYLDEEKVYEAIYDMEV